MSNLEVLVTAYLKKYNYGDIILLKYQSVSVFKKDNKFVSPTI